MGKNRSKKRRLAQQATPSSIVASLTGRKHTATIDDDDDISPEELEITIQTLTTLANQDGNLMENLQNKSYKDLRRALHPFQDAWVHRFDPVDYPAKVTSLLETKQWSSALFALDACAYYFESKLKRGTVQRWIRFCDDCEVSGVKLKLIAAILKCTTTSDGESSSSSSLNKHDPRRAMLLEGDDDMEISKRSTWSVPPVPIKEELLAVKDIDWKVPTDIRVVHHVPACERKPPNHHDLKISFTATNILTDNLLTTIEKHDVTTIPGATVLTNILTRHECQRLIQTAERMGYIPDHPIESKDPTGIDTCEWLAVTESKLIFERVLQHLPSTIQEEPVSGINARWRLFRYGPDSVYRPHIDGSWPCSKLTENGKYVSDDTHRSRLTFLMYLNDGFEGGETTFYLPSSSGGLEAVSVTPQAGSVLLFPQGNTASLVHEGSKVESAGCCKYVIRTDVLYEKK